MARKEEKKSKYASLRGSVETGKNQVERKSGGTLSIGDKQKWEPKKGLNTIDIIPYEVSIHKPSVGVETGQLFQQLSYSLHFGVGAQEKTIVCPASLGMGLKCPLCEARALMFKDKNADKEEIDALKPKKRVAFNIIDVDDPDAGVQIYDESPFKFAEILYDEIIASNGEFATVFDLDAGFSIKIRYAEGVFNKNKYLKAARIDFLDREPYGDDIVADTIDLDAALNVLSYKDIEAIFLDIEGEVEAEREQEPVKNRQRNREPEPEQESENKGRQRNRNPEPEQEKEEEPEPESRGRNRNRKQEQEEPEPERETKHRGRQREEEKDDNPCPNGFKFGEDCEKETACDTCDVWSDCRDAADQIAAERKSERKRK